MVENMSKRFGRNQKRKFREQISALKSSAIDSRHESNHLHNRIHKLGEKLHYMELTPIAMHLRPHVCAKEDITTFCIDVDKYMLRRIQLTDKSTFNFIANELSHAILGDPELRSLISVERRPMYDMAKIGGF